MTMTMTKAIQQLQQHQQHQPDLSNNIHPQLAQQVQINQQIQQLLQLITQLQEEAVRMLFYTKPSSTESKPSQQRSHHITLHLITSPFKSHNVRNIITLECPPPPPYMVSSIPNKPTKEVQLTCVITNTSIQWSAFDSGSP